MEDLTAIRAQLVADGWAGEEEAAAMDDATLLSMAETINIDVADTAGAAQPRLSDVEIEIQHGAAMFKLPGEDTAVERFDGVIQHVATQKAWFEEAYKQGAKSAPDCHSGDGIKGSRARETRKVGNKSVECFGDCGTCHYGQFESSRNGGNAKDCAEYRVLLVEIEGRAITHMLRAPSTSIEPVRSYLVNLVSQKLSKSTVRTRFSLAHKPGADNYSVLSLSMAGSKGEARLPVPEILRMAEIRKGPTFQYLSGLQAMPAPEEGESGAAQAALPPSKANGGGAEHAAALEGTDEMPIF
jgi:hypothetical protein